MEEPSCQTLGLNSWQCSSFPCQHGWAKTMHHYWDAVHTPRLRQLVKLGVLLSPRFQRHCEKTALRDLTVLRATHCAVQRQAAHDMHYQCQIIRRGVRTHVLPAMVPAQQVPVASHPLRFLSNRRLSFCVSGRIAVHSYGCVLHEPLCSILGDLFACCIREVLPYRRP